MMSTHSLLDRNQFDRNQTMSVMWMSFRRNKTTTITTLILMLVTLPVILFVQSIASTANGASPDYYMAESVFTSLVNFLTMPISLITLILSAGLMFGYLHNKPAIDVFHALPVRRLPLFFGRFFGGFLSIFIPQLIAFSIALVVRLMPTMHILKVSMIVETALATFLMSLAVYAVSVLAFTLTGTIFDALFLIALLNAAYPVTLAAIELFMTMTLPGYTVEASAIQDRYLLFSPIARFFTLVYLRFNLMNTLWWVFLTAVIIVGAALYFRQRKSEMAGVPFACKAPFLVTRFLVTLVVGLFFGFMFYQIRNNLILYAVGVLIGSFTSHLVIEVILSRGFGSFGRSLISYGVFILAFVIGCLVIVYGFLGYDYRLPAENRIAAIELTTDELQPLYQPDGTMQFPTFKDPANRAAILALHKAWIDQMKTLVQHPYTLSTVNQLESRSRSTPLAEEPMDGKGNPSYGYHPSSRIAYKLAGGSTMVRIVYIDYTEEPYATLAKQLKQSEEYALQKYIALFQPAENILELRLVDKTNQDFFILNGKEADDHSRIVQLQDALKADYLAGKNEVAGASVYGVLMVNGISQSGQGSSQMVLTDAFTQTLAALDAMNLKIDPSAMSGRFSEVYIGFDSKQLSTAMEMNSMSGKIESSQVYTYPVVYYPYGDSSSPVLNDERIFLKVDDQALIDALYQAGQTSWPDLDSGYLLAFATPGQVGADGLSPSGPLPVLHLPADLVPAALTDLLNKQ